MVHPSQSGCLRRPAAGLLGSTRVSLQQCSSRPAHCNLSRSRHRLVCLSKFSNPFGNAGKGGGSEDAARKALENMFGKRKGADDAASKLGKGAPGPPAQPKQGGGLSSLFGAGAGAGAGAGGRPRGGDGGGDGGGWKWGKDADDGGESGAGKPIWQEFLDLMRGIWVVFWNAALFLAFANMLHRSLDWCCQVELLLLVGAPRQAFERVAGKFYNMVEWIEENSLGWRIPREKDTIPMYQDLALYYPAEHAYTFEAYKHPGMTLAEKEVLRNAWALRWWERDGGYAGDTSPREVEAILDKYNPQDADLQRFQRMQAEGREAEYWAENEGRLRAWTGSGARPT